MATETIRGTIASATTPVSVALTGYYQNVTVENLAASGGTTIWVRADGIAAVAGADGAFPVLAGQVLSMANGLGYWTQAFSVISKGAVVGGVPGTPAETYPYGSSLAGGVANPGVTVSAVLDNGTTSTTFEVASDD